MKKIQMIISLLLLKCGLFAATTNTITLQDFISNAVANNPEIFMELTGIKQADALEDQAEAIYSVLLDSSYYYGYENPMSYAESNIGIVEQTSQSLGFGLSGMLPGLGSRYSVGLDIAQSDISAYIPDLGAMDLFSLTNLDYNDIPVTLSNVTAYQPEITFQFSQPLLQNWLGIVDQFPLRQAEINTEVTELTVDETIETLIIELYEVYFDWYLNYHQMIVVTESIENSEMLLTQIKNKKYYGLADDSDVYKVRIMNLEYKKARDLLKLMTQLKMKKVYHWMYGDVEPPDDQYFIPEEEIVLNDIPAKKYSSDDSRQMQMLDLAKQLLVYQLKKERSEALPELNLLFQYSLKNTGYNQYSAFDLPEFNDNYFIGLEFSVPIGEKLNKGSIEELQAELEEWDYQVLVFERLYDRGIQDLYDSLAIYEAVLEYDQTLIELSELLVEEEEEKYQQGRSDLYYIIESDNSLIQYQLTYLSDYVDYKLLQLEFLGLIDSLYP